MIEKDSNPTPLAEIEVGPSAFEQFLERNQKALIAVAVLIVLAAAALIVHRNMRHDTERKAAAALILCYDETTGKYDADSLQKVTADFPGTPAAETASYLYTVALWDAGRTEDSLKALGEFIVEAPADSLRNQAALVQACRLLKLGQEDKAQESFQMVVDSQDPVFAPVALMTLGDMARARGENDKAKALYEEVLAKYPDSSFSFNQRNAGTASTLIEQFAYQSPAARRIDLLGIKSPDKKLPPLELPRMQAPGPVKAPTLPGMPGLK